MEEYQENTVSKNNFEECIKCTICTVYCPVTAVNPDYPGPKQAGPDGERYRLKKPFFYDEALKYCLNCKRCEVACPSNVKIGDIIQSARIKYSKHAPDTARPYACQHGFHGHCRDSVCSRGQRHVASEAGKENHGLCTENR